jgi:hypothetical protein
MKSSVPFVLKNILSIRSSRIGWITALVIIWAAAPAIALAQDAELALGINKVIGYGSFGNREFQGIIRVFTRGPDNLQRVIFYIDGETMAEDTEAPFEVRFDTGSYALGDHTFTGIGYTNDGQELQSQPLTVKFVTAQAGMKAAMSFLIPLLVVVFGAILLSWVVPILLSRGKKLETPLGAQRKYGFAGGAICPRCSRPFPIPFLALNLGPAHRLARCPYCGKTGLMRRRSIDELRRAEAAELEMAAPAEPLLSEEEKLRKEIEESRYHNI